MIYICGFPRSGNMFLYSSLSSIYGVDEVDRPTHTILKLEENVSAENNIVVPFRTPDKCIASWALYRDTIFPDHLHNVKFSIDDHISFYIRYMSECLNIKDNVLFLDFSKFTTNLDYLKNAIFDRYQIFLDSSLSVLDIESQMNENGLYLHLPSDNTEELEAYRQIVIENSRYDQVLDIYNQIKSIEEGISE